MTDAAPSSRTATLALWVAVLASFVSFLDGTVVNVALPAISADLGGGISTQQWVVDAYMLTLGALILVAGSMSDLYGRVRVLAWGLVGFGITSVAIGLAPTAEFMIAARALQGVAGALLVPSSLAIIMATHRGAAQARAIGVWTAATSSAMVVGPLVGGLLVDFASWRWVFLINVLPIAAVLVMLRGLRIDQPRRPDARVDVVSALLCTAGLGAIVYALIEQPAYGWTLPIVLAAVVGVASLAAFLERQRRVPQPMLPLALFRERNFAWGNLATFFIYGGLALMSFVVSVYLQQGAGLSATLAGLSLLPITLVMIVLSSSAGGWAGRWGPRLFMTAGPLIMASGAASLLLVRDDFDYWTQVLPGVLLFGTGLALTVSPLTSAVLGAAPPERAGVASATNNAVSRIAGVVPIAALALIVGGQLDLAGFGRAVVATAVLIAVGGLVSWAGIRNPASPADSPAAPAPAD